MNAPVKISTKVEATAMDEYPEIFISPLENDPPYAQCVERERAISVKFGTVQERIDVHWNAIDAARKNPSAPQPKLNARIKALAGIAASENEEDEVDHAAEINKLCAERDDLKTALGLIADEKRRLKGPAALKAKALIADEYDAIVRETIDLVKKLHRVLVSQYRLAVQLDQLQIGTLGAKYVYPGFMMTLPTDNFSGVAHYLRQCAAAGHIKFSEIPAMIRTHAADQTAMKRRNIY